MYKPPFSISTKSINLIAEISAQIERYAVRMEQEDGLLLRKINRIKTIQGSLAIEGNTLSESMITGILEGKLFNFAKYIFIFNLFFVTLFDYCSLKILDLWTKN